MGVTLDALGMTWCVCVSGGAGDSFSSGDVDWTVT